MVAVVKQGPALDVVHRKHTEPVFGVPRKDRSPSGLGNPDMQRTRAQRFTEGSELSGPFRGFCEPHKHIHTRIRSSKYCLDLIIERQVP